MKHLLVLAALLLACTVRPEADGDGTGDGPDEADLCARGEECDFLQISEESCIEVETICTNGLTPQEKADWALLLGGCLKFQSCQNFNLCVLDLPDCSPDPFWSGDLCDPSCDTCWIGGPVENMCQNEWNGGRDGCDCGCQFIDFDC